MYLKLEVNISYFGEETQKNVKFIYFFVSINLIFGFGFMLTNNDVFFLNKLNITKLDTNIRGKLFRTR